MLRIAESLCWPEDRLRSTRRSGVPDSYGWTSRPLLDDRVQLSYALNGAQDNPEREASNSRFKSEN